MSDTKKLIKYLETVVELEKVNYEQNKILENLDFEYQYYSNPKYRKEKDYGYADLKFEFFFGLETEDILVWVFAPALIVTIIAFLLYLFFSIGLTLLIIGALVSIISILVVLSKAKEEYNKIVEENKIIDRENRKIQEYNSNLKQVYSERVDSIAREYNAILEEYRMTQETLKRYYNIGIIYPKYRNFACIASILEYFLSGRCTKLTGHEGAYNILEEEIRYRGIITKLDIIIDKIDDIRMNQSYLYNAILECNDNINNISGSITNSINQIKNINKNINKELISANYINDVNRMNIEYLADMELYKSLFYNINK